MYNSKSTVPSMVSCTFFTIVIDSAYLKLLFTYALSPLPMATKIGRLISQQHLFSIAVETLF